MPKQQRAHRRGLQARHPGPTTQARPGRERRRPGRRRADRRRGRRRRTRRAADVGRDEDAGPVNTEDARERLFALPERPHNVDRADVTGQLDSLLGEEVPGYETFKGYFAGVLRFDPQDDGAAARSRRAPRSPPAPCSAASARPTSSRRTSTSRSSPPAAARRRSTRSRSSTAGSCSRRRRSTAPPARTRSAARRSVGQILLMSKAQLDAPGAGRPAPRDLLLRPRRHPHRPDRPPRCWRCSSTWPPAATDLTITSLKCGHSIMTTSGNVSRPLLRRRGRHRRRSTASRPRQPGPGLDHRGGGQRPAARCRGRCSRTRSSR